MSVAVYVTNDSDAATLIPWAVHLASFDHLDIEVYCPRKSKGKTSWNELTPSAETSSPLQQAIFSVLSQQCSDTVVLKSNVAADNQDNDHNRSVVTVLELKAPEPDSALIIGLSERNITLIVLPIFQPAKGGKQVDWEWPERAFLRAPCGVICVRGAFPEKEAPRLLLVSENNLSAEDEFALTKTAQLGRATRGPVTLLYVRPSDDPVARHVAERHLDQLERNIRSYKLDLRREVALANSLAEGIKKLDLSEIDLIVVGTKSRKVVRQLVNQLVPADESPPVPLAVMRQGVPLANRLWHRIRSWTRSVVPQIEREQRISLVDRIHSSSNFDFDFLALISLSTLIAALGLARNSSAVVIGAMLVAPLMTPLVAIGLALVQGNERLVKSAFKSVVLGFAISLAIGMLVGLSISTIAPQYAITTEMRSRDWPNLLDLIVALASGVAAAYALGRPHLVSALPGVAIAAALVPPVATAGLSLAMGDWLLARGASLLFFTNIVAIILGTAITFWAVGISTFVENNETERAARMWPRYLFLGFVIISFVLAGEMSIFNPLNQNRNWQWQWQGPPAMELPAGETTKAL